MRGPENRNDHWDWLDRLVHYVEINLKTTTISRATQAAADLLGVADSSELVGVDVINFSAAETMKIGKEQYEIALQATELESRLIKFKVKKQNGSSIDVEGLTAKVMTTDGPALSVAGSELGTTQVPTVDIQVES